MSMGEVPCWPYDMVSQCGNTISATPPQLGPIFLSSNCLQDEIKRKVTRFILNLDLLDEPEEIQTICRKTWDSMLYA